jgi:hypothetical protein
MAQLHSAADQVGRAFEAMVARYLRAHGFEVVEASERLDRSAKVDLLVRSPKGRRYLLQLTLERREEVVLARRDDGGLADRPGRTSKLRTWQRLQEGGTIAALLKQEGLADWVGAASIFVYADGWFGAIRSALENEEELPEELGQFLVRELSAAAASSAPAVLWHNRHARKGARVAADVFEAALYQEIRLNWR